MTVSRSKHFQLQHSFHLTTGVVGVGGDGGGGEVGDEASPCLASLGLSASSVCPSSWLKEDQVLALLLITVTKRLVGTGLGRGGGGSGGAVAGGGACWGPAGALVTPGAGGSGEADAGTARGVPWWSAARCLRRALAAAPRWRRRRPPGAGVKAAGVAGVVVEEGEGGDSNWSLMVDLPSLDRIVKETVSPATCNSSNKLMTFWNSGFIF